jgi:hypothetical protein
MVEAVFKQSVEALKAAHPEFGKHEALDSTDTRTHGHPARQRRDTQGNPYQEPATDLEASWSIKTKITAKGEKKKITFGYKTFAMVIVSTRTNSAATGR